MPVDAMSKMRYPTVLAQPLFSIEHTMEEQLTILSQDIIFSNQMVAIERGRRRFGKDDTDVQPLNPNHEA